MAYVENVLSQAESQRKIAKEVTDRCINEVESKANSEYFKGDGDHEINEPKTDLRPPAKTSAPVHQYHSCDPKALKLTICVWVEFTRKCLEQNPSVRKCIRLQERFDDFVSSRMPQRDHVIVGE